MKQMTFADAEYAGKRKQTRKELFLIEMDQVVPWKGLVALIDPHYPKGEGGRPAYPLMAIRPTGSSPKPQQEALQAFLEAPKAMASRGQKIIDSELDRIIT